MNFQKNFPKIKIPLPFIGLSIVLLIVFNIICFLFSTWGWYSYSTRDGRFTFDAFPAKGRDLKMMKTRWKTYVESNHPADTVIYRTFPKNYLYAWYWLKYTRPEYDFPYLDTNQDD